MEKKNKMLADKENYIKENGLTIEDIYKNEVIPLKNSLGQMRKWK